MNMAESIVIILDESNPMAPIFKDIEKISGISINIGHRTVKHGLTHLHITIDDIKNK